jgi:hypothetical protein
MAEFSLDKYCSGGLDRTVAPYSFAHVLPSPWQHLHLARTTAAVYTAGVVSALIVSFVLRYGKIFSL